ncbi:hypothetical protein AA0498_2746 [Acidomonas methanolica]|nr:hypothetical protein AA0498_2746 [Acidomonas methanolica]
MFANGKRAGVYSQPLVVLNISQVFPVASLPATCTNGAIVWAANGRTPTEAAGAGTGVTAVCKSNIWYSMLSNLAVTQ